MKLTRKNSTLTAAYLYSDGHAVVLYEQRVKIGDTFKTVEFAEVHEKFCAAQISFIGRLVLHRYHALAFLELAQLAQDISCKRPTVENGSETTRKLGLAYGALQFTIGGSYLDIPMFCEPSGLSFNSDSFNSICSNGYSFQPDSKGAFAESTADDTWGNETPIAKIHRVPAQIKIQESIAA